MESSLPLSFKWLSGFILIEQDNPVLLSANKSLKFKCEGGGWRPLTFLCLSRGQYPNTCYHQAQKVLLKFLAKESLGYNIKSCTVSLVCQAALTREPLTVEWEFCCCLALSMLFNLSSLCVLPCKMLSPITCMDWIIIHMQNIWHTIEIINSILLPAK